MAIKYFDEISYTINKPVDGVVVVAIVVDVALQAAWGMSAMENSPKVTSNCRHQTAKWLIW